MIIELQSSTFQNFYITALAIFHFPINNHFVYLHEFYRLHLYNLTTFSPPQKSRKSVFLQPNPVCDFDPGFYNFQKTVMITGSGQKKTYIFRFLYCLLLSDFDSFYTILVGFFDDYGVHPFSGYNFFAVFVFPVNNFILYANSTEISGFSVLLCFLRPSILPC